VLARNPVNALGAFQAQERALQSLLAFPSPFVRLHMFTHSTDTDMEEAEVIANEVKQSH